MPTGAGSDWAGNPSMPSGGFNPPCSCSLCTGLAFIDDLAIRDPTNITQNPTNASGCATNTMAWLAPGWPAPIIRNKIAAPKPMSAINAPVSTENNAQAVIILDPTKGTYSIVELSQRVPLPEFLRQHGVTALLCQNLAQSTATSLAAKGISVSNGIVGTVSQVLSQYQKQAQAVTAGP